MKLPASVLHGAGAFSLPGPILSVTAFGQGLIHHSYLVEAGETTTPYRYVLQEINTHIFPDPAALMENIERVLDHLGGAAKPGQQMLRWVPTHRGASWMEQGGQVWRMFQFVEGTKAISGCPTRRQAEQIGCAFGTFLDTMRTFPHETLHRVIPGYRDTSQYLDAFDRAVREDRLERTRAVHRDISGFASRTGDALFLQTLVVDNRIPQRAIHGDTKLDNALLHAQTDRAVCVVDLDTVMSGVLLHDLADSLRELLLRAAPLPSPIPPLQAMLVAALLAGFLGSLSRPLSLHEAESVVRATLSICLELGVRFLTDYLQGGITFRVSTPRETLDRARQHLLLATSIEANCAQLEEIVEQVLHANPASESPHNAGA